MDLAATFDSLSREALEGYVARKQEENLQLEFKTLSTPDLERGEDKKLLARVVSAFANSSGGLVVWGVETRRGDDGLDRAAALKEVPRVAVLLARLNELDGAAVSPAVLGLRHKVIPSAPDSESGFAVTLVPESESGPHMAKMGDDRYYKRSGHRRYRMEHFDIADMFGRRLKPRLELTARSRSGGTEIIVGLRNVGRGIARAPYLAISTELPFRRSPWGIDGNHHEGLPYLIKDSPMPPWRYGATANDVIHPGVARDVSCLMSQGNTTRVAPEGVLITYEIACDGMQLTAGTHLFPAADLR